MSNEQEYTITDQDGDVIFTGTATQFIDRHGGVHGVEDDLEALFLLCDMNDWEAVKMAMDTLLHNGAILNPILLVEKEMTHERVQKLKQLHFLVDQVCDRAFKEIERLEFEMQRVWGFDEDPDKHTHKHRIKRNG